MKWKEPFFEGENVHMNLTEYMQQLLTQKISN